MPAKKEQRAITKAEELGFTSREPNETKETKAEGKGRVMRRHEQTPKRSRARHPSWTVLWPLSEKGSEGESS
jgi:hypothetical protein